MNRVLVVGSPGLTFEQVRPHLDDAFCMLGPYEIVAVCDWVNGRNHTLDWCVERWARDAGHNCTVGFQNCDSAVDYVKGHSLLAFFGGPSDRCRDALLKAKNKRRWFSRKHGRWTDDRIKITVIDVEA